MMNLTQVKKMAKDEKDYLEKLQRNRTKAAKAKKVYWQNRIDEYFMDGVMK